MNAAQHLRKFGRPIAYYPQLNKLFGGVAASILFGQLFYWMPKAKSAEGVYKTAQEITEETGLSVQEQRTARKKLRDLGVLIETHKRFEHKLYFLIDESAFNALWEATFAEETGQSGGECQHSRNAKSTFANSQINIRRSAKSTFANSQINIRRSAKSTFANSQINIRHTNTRDYLQETTHKTTSCARPRAASVASPPDPLPAVRNPSSPKPPKRTRYLPGFERFWFAYTHPPAGCTARTGGKSKAHEYWRRDRLESIADELTAKAGEFWARDHSWRSGYQPFAQKWLNEKRYDDDPQEEIIHLTDEERAKARQKRSLRDWASGKEKFVSAFDPEWKSPNEENVIEGTINATE